MTRQFYKLPVDVAARRDLPGNAKVLYAVIADRIGDNGEAWPGMRTLAAVAGAEIKAVVRAVKALEATGLLLVERAKNEKTGETKRSGRSNRYSLPKTEEGEAESAPKTGTLSESPPKRKRSQNGMRGVPKTGTEALPKRACIQTESLSQREAASPSAVRFDEEALAFTIPPKVLDQWRTAFPTVDIDGELLKAAAWHAANGKWRSAFQAALQRWLSRAAKDLEGKGGGFTVPAERNPTAEDLAVAFDIPIDEARRQIAQEVNP